jgi:DNA-binding NarL/FixJ family response regulator
VVVIDAALPGLDSVEATRRICAQSGPAVIVLTATDDDDVILAVLRAGASAVLMKDRPAELIYAIESAARGEALLSPRVARRLIAEFVARPEPVSPDPELVDELTAREREVVQLVALGLSNDQIAERLVITRGTAKTHVSRAMVKVRAHDRAKLVVFAYEAGLALPRVQACGAA